jgi:hypothetical protein
MYYDDDEEITRTAGRWRTADVLLWLKSGRCRTFEECPLYPLKALCQKRTPGLIVTSKRNPGGLSEFRRPSRLSVRIGVQQILAGQ